MKSKKPDDCTILQYRTKQHLLELGWGKRVYVDQIILTSIHTGKNTEDTTHKSFLMFWELS